VNFIDPNGLFLPALLTAARTVYVAIQLGNLTLDLFDIFLDPPKPEKAFPGDFKKLGNNCLKQFDPENFKEDIVGNNGKNFNIAKDKKGNIFLIPVKMGSGPNITTDFTFNDLVNLYPKNR
jgi:hypothetical protein